MSGIEFVQLRCVEVGECWEWATPVTIEGKRFPSMRLDGKVTNARRYAYEQARGPIKPGMVLSQNCGNPYCINPAHHVQVTKRAALQRAGKQGRMSQVSPTRIASVRARGKLSMEIAQEMRNSDEHPLVLAERYGVHKSTVYYVRRGKLWRDHSSPFAGLLS